MGEIYRNEFLRKCLRNLSISVKGTRSAYYFIIKLLKDNNTTCIFNSVRWLRCDSPPQRLFFKEAVKSCLHISSAHNKACYLCHPCWNVNLIK